jgi:hypothetical protein
VLLSLRRDVNEAADRINQVELVRSQLHNLARLVGDADIKKAVEELDKKLIDAESNFIELRVTGRGADVSRWGSRLMGKLNYLANQIMSSDFKPTDQHQEVQKVLEDRLHEALNQLEVLLMRDLGAFNDLLRKRNIGNIILQVP